MRVSSGIRSPAPKGLSNPRNAFMSVAHRSKIPVTLVRGRRSSTICNVAESERTRPVIESKPNDPESLKADILDKIVFERGHDPSNITPKAVYEGAAWSLRERLIERFAKTEAYWREKDPKFVYYLSAEFLMGRALLNTAFNLQLKKEYSEALRQLGYTLEEVYGQELDQALGNGGLGRLAACFLDSIATLDLPGWGYGIRYQYGIFKQALKEGKQVEMADIWLKEGNPWEIPRYNIKYRVGFFGDVQERAVDGKKQSVWTPSEEVWAVAYDNPVPGYATETCGNLRLWACESVTELDLDKFNVGQFSESVELRRRAEAISSVLYPNDSTQEGKELRLKQQFFFVSASLQDVIARHKARHGSLAGLADKAIFQLNDTHPTIAVAELMRLLIDGEGLSWDDAWALTTKALAFTNHTIMPEALEKWPVAVMGRLLPRHLQIIETIDSKWKTFVKQQCVGALASSVEELVAAEEAELTKKAEANAKPAAATDAKAADAKPAQPAIDRSALKEKAIQQVVDRISIIQENPWNKGEMLINMAYLAVVGSSAVNGVAAIHSELIKQDLFPDFVKIWPNKFQNKTNGITPRRWMAECNPALAELITNTLGTDKWVRDLSLLQGLKPYADDADFRKKWRDVKMHNKKRLAAKIKEITGDDVNLNAMFDIQIKRLHEYKRQFMNALSIIWRYKQIKAMSPEERKKVVPRVCVFAGKAASAYDIAKRIIRLITAIGEVVNNDPEVNDLLRVYFLPNYRVSLAEVLIPAAELSQHISTAGTEASGTSNMKFQGNGSLIIGTMDGANIEIGEESGFNNMFIFGVSADEVPQLRKERKHFKTDPRWDQIMKWIRDGEFGEKEYFQRLVDSVDNMNVGNDWFLLANDFASYLKAQEEVDEVYKDQEEWTKRSILMSAGVGFFSSDRTIDQYAREIWNVKPLPVPK